MLKELIKAYLQTRLNAIDKEIEDLSEIVIKEEDDSKQKKCNCSKYF